MVIHISEAEAESDFGSVLARVRAGAEVIIESEERRAARWQSCGRLGHVLAACFPNRLL